MDPRGGGEGGGVALLTLCGGLVLLMAGLLVLSSVTEVGIAAARARTAADAAALAAVSTALPQDGCARARTLTEANGARLDTCRIPAPGAVIVEVTVHPRSALVRHLAGALPARAAAVWEPAAVEPGTSG